MDLIIVQPVQKFKTIGQIVNVKKGYARNFLLPQGFALVANEQNKKKFEELREKLSTKGEEKNQAASQTAELLEGKVLNFIAQTLEDGKLFGSIRAKNIAQALGKEHNVDIRSTQVELTSAITKIGVYKVRIALYRDLYANLLINIARNDIEAASQLTIFHSSQEPISKIDDSLSATK